MKDRFHVWIAGALLVGVGIFAIYYLYMFVTYTGGFSFSGSERWHQTRGIDTDIMIGLGRRALYFAMWLPTVIATEVMLLASMWLAGLGLFVLGWILQLTVMIDRENRGFV